MIHHCRSRVKGESQGSSKVKGERSKENTNGVTLKVLRKHIKRLVNYAEAGDGGKIREELKRIVPEYRPEDGRRRTEDG